MLAPRSVETSADLFYFKGNRGNKGNKGHKRARGAKGVSGKIK
jgi:hypothetical protein